MANEHRPCANTYGTLLYLSIFLFTNHLLRAKKTFAAVSAVPQPHSYRENRIGDLVCRGSIRSVGECKYRSRSDQRLLGAPQSLQLPRNLSFEHNHRTVLSSSYVRDGRHGSSVSSLITLWPGGRKSLERNLKIKAFIAALYRIFCSNDPDSRDAFVEVDPSLHSSGILGCPWWLDKPT